jgi:hypothetical protein
MTPPVATLHPADQHLLQTVMERLSDLPGALRQSLNDSLWQSIAADNYEYGYAPAQVANTPLTVNAKTSTIFRVEAFVAVIPSGATGVLQLADVVIPLSQGLQSANGLRLQLAQADLRSLTATVQGPVSLLLTGEQLPPWGDQTR